MKEKFIYSEKAKDLFLINNIVSGKCKSIKIMANGTIEIKHVPETWGTDSHVSVYMNKFVYSIGGFR